MTNETGPSRHNIELQSLRGIAATLVMVHHALRVFAGETWAWSASEVVLNAEAAVIIFFVLSGYVLSCSLARRGLDRQGLTIFFVRRAFRIYPALWVGLALGTAYLLLAHPLPAQHLSAWTNGHYTDHQETRTLIFESFFGLSNSLLPPAWTITAELCGSIALPAMVWAFLRYPRSAVPVIILLAITGLIAGPALRNVPYYFVHFAFGAALGCVPWLRTFRPRGGILLLTLCVMLLGRLFLPGYPWAATIMEGICGLVLIAGLVARARPWLRHRWLVKIGDWSYSIYLLHLPVAFTVARLLDHAGVVDAHRDIWALVVALATVAITVPLSGLVYHYVELPGIAAGTALIRRARIRQWPVRNFAEKQPR
jgi:peptidoglycan/LPS O-acetylase OafA/YrhL